MTFGLLQLRGLRHHWRMHLTLAICSAVGTAALTGALLVGDSMRGSLREHALRRLGPVQTALRGARFLRAEVAHAVGGAGVVMLQGSVEHAQRRLRANRVQIIGADAGFGALWGQAGSDLRPNDGAQLIDMLTSDDRSVVLNQSLATKISATVGDDVLLRLTRASTVPTESVLGRPDEAAASLRLTVRGVIDDTGLGGFSLDFNQGGVLNAFVPLAAIQRSIDRDGRVNAILCGLEGQSTGADALPSSRGTSASNVIHTLNDRLAHAISPADFDLRIVSYDVPSHLAVESERLLLDPQMESAVERAAERVQARVGRVLTYLANDIALSGTSTDTGRSVPYSVVAAMDQTAIDLLLPQIAPQWNSVGPDGIVFCDWIVGQLGPATSDHSRAKMTYYVSGAVGGELAESTHDFTVIAERYASADLAPVGLLPAYRGITDAATLSAWNPPSQFRIDLKRITPADESYWKQFRGTPKALIALATGQRLWTDRDPQHGRLTSMRIATPESMTSADFRHQFEAALTAELNPERVGVTFDDIRARATAAGQGSTDFGMLFISFSFFIIAAAGMLIGLVFRLNLERRASEIGLLAALGFPQRVIGRLFFTEGAIVAAVGGVLGTAGAALYAWLMVAGLRTWWVDAVGATFLGLHLSMISLSVGLASSFLIAAGSLKIAMRGLSRHSPRALLSGTATIDDEVVSNAKKPELIERRAAWPGRRASRWAIRTLLVAALVGVGAIVAAIATDAVPAVTAFFVCGTALLVAGLAALAILIGRPPTSVIYRGGLGAIVRLSVRNASRRRSRTLTTAALLSCAAFVIIAVGAARHTEGGGALARDGGTGGYSEIMEASIPLPFDPAIESGRENLGISDATAALLTGSTIMPLRLKPGDDASCLNLYSVARPRILGAPASFIDRGGFRFQSSLARTAEERGNPWTLLRHPIADGAIPAIGDANALTWLLKIGLGDDFVVADEAGRQRRLRIVGMLSGSVLQSELIVSEDSFKDLYPSASGFGLVLMATATEKSREVLEHLQRDLSRYGVDAELTLARLNRYRAVENTYMAAFQTLGGIGLMMGTLGLAAVMLRNITERRGEFALIRALGFSRRRVELMVFAENASVLSTGLLIGVVAAISAVLPHILSRPHDVDWKSLAWTIAAVFVIGLSAGGLAVRAAARAPILGALRSE
ncbi:MAG: FtsX-like permease family protein [Phycisphaerae bacterium]|nr:FtsX-like permease family protein [Phycisphaerae bacterium]